MGKLQPMKRALSPIEHGATIMIGGFMGCGSPHAAIEYLVGASLRSLTIIANDAGLPGYGIGKLVAGGRIKKLIASHIGLNPEAGQRMNTGEMVVDLVPQGTLAERIRSGGVGLGGILTPTGLGTIVEEGKQIIETDTGKFLLETAMKADAALIKAFKADDKGNLLFRQTARNFNPIMAMAADYVVAEVDEYLGMTCLAPDEIHLPGIFVDAIVLSGSGDAKQNREET